MKKILISAGWLALMLSTSVKAQNLPSVENEPQRKLTVDEVNFVSSYYRQKGNNAAVTGGIGSEELKDEAAGVTIKLSFWDKKDRKNTLTADASYERYTSASSDQIDPATQSSASSSDMHFYPSITWDRKNEKTGNSVGMGGYFSTEYDYKSVRGSVFFTKVLQENGEFTTKLNVFRDQIMVILPAELRPESYPTGAKGDKEGISYKPRNSYALNFSFSKIINPDFHILLMAEPSFQEGLLSLPFHRVYFNDGSLKVEKLPGQRWKLPLSARANYFASDGLVLRSYYRFYIDNWGLTAHTFNLEPAIKFSSFFSLLPHWRFSVQSGVDSFMPYAEHSPDTEFYTSDYDLSAFTSNLIGIGFRSAPPKGIWGIKSWRSWGLRYGYYQRSNGLSAHTLSLALGFR